MKKRLLLMIALLFISGASMAQKVVNVDGKAVIDNRDMPAKSIITARKVKTTNGTNTTEGTNNQNNLGSAESNKTVSHYFEVMKTDYSKTLTTWTAAILGCASYNSGDGDKSWRLPTQRELMLIWALHLSLKNKVTDFVLFTPDNYWSNLLGNYWSASENGASNSWYVNFSNGATSSVSKSNTIWVRCVRDLTPPTK